MRQLLNVKLPRVVLFLTFNASLVLFVVLFVVGPLLSHFSDRSEEISENEELLSHFRSMNYASQDAAAKNEQASDPFFPGPEERLVSADIQANLKSIVASAGARFLGMYGQKIDKKQPLHMVAVNLELEGSLQTIRDVIGTIETQTPFLFITSAELRHEPDADESIIQAELRVQGAMRDHGVQSELTAPMDKSDDSRALIMGGR